MEAVIVTTPSQLREIVAEAVAEAAERLQMAGPRRETLTLEQLAEEWQVTRQAIHNWIRRDEHPLPVHYLGNAPRFHRFEVESWSREEAKRRRGGF